MTNGRRTPEIFDSREGAQLQRDVVGTIVHDLTSITSALALRVEAAHGALAERDTQAVAELTAQLRAATRPLVWLRGSPGRGALSPSRSIEIGAWWHHTSHVIASLLPRGTHLMLADDAISAEDFTLPSEELTRFQMLVLGTCRHYADLYPVGAISMNVTLPRAADLTPGVRLELTSLGESPLEPLATRSTRWKRFCTRTANRAGLSLSWWQPTSGATGSWQWSVHRAV